MHMQDALISPYIGAAFTGISVLTNAYCLKKMEKESNKNIVPLMGVMGAFVFSAQMLNVTIPGTGSSGHIMGDLLLCAILGPYATFVTMSAILLIQALLFADGGILAYGANVFNMAFFTCFIGYPLIFKPILERKGSFYKNLLLGSVITKVLSSSFGAFAVVFETFLSFKIDIPFDVFLISMEGIHIVIGLLEGFATYFVLSYIYKEKPEIIYSNNSNVSTKSLTKSLIPFAVIALMFGGIFSIFASSKPDGLEWSLEKVVDVEEIEQTSEGQSVSLFDDYQIGSDDKSENFKTSMAGIVGTIVTLGATLAIGNIMARKKREVNENNI